MTKSLAFPNLSVASIGVGGEAGLVGKGGGGHHHHQHQEEEEGGALDTLGGLQGLFGLEGTGGL